MGAYKYERLDKNDAVSLLLSKVIAFHSADLL